MYKKHFVKQTSLTDFNQPFGLELNPNNRWVKLAALVPWSQFEDKYAMHFIKPKGGVAKPFRMALGALIIQAKTQLSDRELVEQIEENPYYQFFIGLPKFQHTCPFTYSALPHFRMRITPEMLKEINEYVLKTIAEQKAKDEEQKPPKNDSPSQPKQKDEQCDTAKNGAPEDVPVQGTLILDATCAPSNIRFPMDCSLLNEAREKLEKMIKELCKANAQKIPRLYIHAAHKDYLNIAKCKKPSHKKIAQAVKQQLQYVRRDLRYVGELLAKGFELGKHSSALLVTIKKLYEQQKYMYDNKIHTIEDRIVSITQPFVRPIVRGKANKPVEFGAKLEISIDANGYQRLETISFDAYNEQKTLQEAVQRYYERTGCYPERVLVDKIYNNRNNRKYCKNLGIRISGPALGRPKKDNKADKKIEYQDLVDRIDVERNFSRDKHSFGMGLVKAKLEPTIKTIIAMSILTGNLFKALQEVFVCIFACLLQICRDLKMQTELYDFKYA